MSDVLEELQALIADGIKGLENAQAEIAKRDATIDTLTRRVEELEGENAWHPIETAPTYSGERVLVFGGRYTEPEKVCSDGVWWRMNQGEIKGIPTHWMPLPTPPKGEDHG